MPDEHHVTHLSLLFDGACPPDLLDDVLEVEVEQSLFLPDMFTILIKDGGAQFQWMDHASFEIGKEVEIAFETDTGGGRMIKGALVKGEIAALEPSFLASGRSTLLVRGYGKAHRLHRGRKTRTFVKMTDAQMVQKIAQEAGLRADVDATSVTHDWVLQNNQTNMEFLQHRAGRIGYSVWVGDGVLCFKKAGADRGPAPTLKFGESLVSFSPRLAVTHQADKISVRGWDQQRKQPIRATVEPSAALNQGGIGKTGGAVAQAAFGSAEAMLTDRPVATPEDAKAVATGLGSDIARDAIHAEGACAGDPRVQAGCRVTIEGVGRRFSGDYQITAATHHWTPSGYATTFRISGRIPDTFGRLLEADGEHAQGLMRGVVPALVTNLNDPERLGRIKVKYAALGDQIESDWMRVAAPMAGKDRGLCAMPEVDDEALVAFEHGDPHRPYAVGFLWSSQDRPPASDGAAVENGQVKRRLFKSKSGHVIVLDDTPGRESIIIRDKTGRNELAIKSPENSVEIRAAGNLAIRAKGDVAIEGQNLSLKASGEATLEGANATLGARAAAKLKGARVQIEANGPVSVQGRPIQLN